MQITSPDFEDHLKELFDTPKDKERVKVLQYKAKKKDKKDKNKKLVKDTRKGRK